jgi:hypothetical protein
MDKLTFPTNTTATTLTSAADTSKPHILVPVTHKPLVLPTDNNNIKAVETTERDELLALIKETANANNIKLINDFLLFMKTRDTVQKPVELPSATSHMKLRNPGGDFSKAEVVAVLKAFQPRSDKCTYEVIIGQHMVTDYNKKELFDSVTLIEYEDNEKSAVYIFNISANGQLVKENNYQNNIKFMLSDTYSYSISTANAGFKVKYNYDANNKLVMITNYNKLYQLDFSITADTQVNIHASGIEPDYQFSNIYIGELMANKHYHAGFYVAKTPTLGDCFGKKFEDY